MSKILEWPLNLFVAEVAEPYKLRDPRLPTCAHGQITNRSETDLDSGTRAGHILLLRKLRPGNHGIEGRRRPLHPVDPHSHPLWHEQGEIIRIREKREGK